MDAPAPRVDFPASSQDDWLALVARTLKDKPVESLGSATAEGLPIAPLYGQARRPAAFPPRPFDPQRPWDIRCLSGHPDPAVANRDLLADLAGGAASGLVRIDPTGQAGVCVGDAQGLAQVLEGVILELAPIGLDAGFLGPKAADWLGAVAKASPGARLNFHMDPLSAFAQAGASPGPIESHLVSAATVGARLAQAYPQAQLFLASGRFAHEAGAGEALEVASAMAAALAYAKAQVRAGMARDQAFARITLGLAADADYFLTIAKLRAARLVWAQLAGACGADPQARLEMASSRRMLSAQDPWTNMIRLTAAGFGAAVGGADAVALGTFTDALGLPGALARRQSRNLQLVLMEEAHVGRVADPAAGSGYVEAMTDQIARAAWAAFQGIEAAGGLIRALAGGLVAEEIARTNAARPRPVIVGVTVFAPDAQVPVEVERPAPRPVPAPSPRLPGPDGACPPLAPIRLAQPFETGAA